MYQKQNFKKRAFTTIEVLIVISVIAVLTAGVLYAVQNARVQTQNEEIKKVMSELEGKQDLIKSEKNVYGGYDNVAGSFEDVRLQEISEEIEDINSVGIDDSRLVKGTSESWGVVTPTIEEQSVLCFSSEMDRVTRKNVDYSEAVAYMYELENNDWDCNVANFSANTIPQNVSTTDSYARINEYVTSAPIEPDDYNAEVIVNPQSGVQIQNVDRGTGWQSQVNMSPGEQIQLRTIPPNPGKHTYNMSISAASVSVLPEVIPSAYGATTATWTIKSDYTSCQDIHNSTDNTVNDINYAIDPSGSGETQSFRVACDMTHDGGGWTLIASYADGNYFNDCSSGSDIDLQHGNSCATVCREFADNSATSQNGHPLCDETDERNIQDSELSKLEEKYVIESSDASGHRDVTQYDSTDFVSQAYHRVDFSKAMFADDTGEFITYDFADPGSYIRGTSGNTSSMKRFYETIDSRHSETIVEYENSNMNEDVNACDNFDLILQATDLDGMGDTNYGVPSNKSAENNRTYGPYSNPPQPYRSKDDVIYGPHSVALAGPQWDSNNNQDCRYDDAFGWWGRKYLGAQPETDGPDFISPSIPQNESNYILWYVK